MAGSTWLGPACSTVRATSWPAASDRPRGYPSSAGCPFPGGPLLLVRGPSQHRNDLRPNGDHADEQSERRERRNLFHGRLEHLILQNIERTLFSLRSRSQAPVVGQFDFSFARSIKAVNASLRESATSVLQPSKHAVCLCPQPPGTQ